MPEAASGFVGFLGLLAVIAIGIVVIAIAFWAWEQLVPIALNLGIAIGGAALIIYAPGNPFAWLFGIAGLALGGFNCKNMISSLAKHGDIDADVMGTVSLTGACLSCGHTVSTNARSCPNCGDPRPTSAKRLRGK